MLDPVVKVSKQLVEGSVRKRFLRKGLAADRAKSLLAQLGFDDPHRMLKLYLHELSGGMARRVSIAMMMPRPAVLLADEPMSALDAHIRGEVLSLLRALAQSEGSAVILVITTSTSSHSSPIGCSCSMPLASWRDGPTDVVLSHPAAAALRPRGAQVAGRRARGCVGINPRRAGERPRAFSGGQLQRADMARAPSLDISVQAQIINLLLELQDDRRFACIVVTHDLAVARIMSDNVAVLRRGEVVGNSATTAFLIAPRTAYSAELLALSAAVRHAGSEGLSEVPRPANLERMQQRSLPQRIGDSEAGL
jgi:ABC-type dipeptide/oligopeptide/nickel transport system ATPase component